MLSMLWYPSLCVYVCVCLCCCADVRMCVMVSMYVCVYACVVHDQHVMVSMYVCVRVSHRKSKTHAPLPRTFTHTLTLAPSSNTHALLLKLTPLITPLCAHTYPHTLTHTPTHKHTYTTAVPRHSLGEDISLTHSLTHSRTRTQYHITHSEKTLRNLGSPRPGRGLRMLIMRHTGERVSVCVCMCVRTGG